MHINYLKDERTAKAKLNTNLAYRNSVITPKRYYKNRVWKPSDIQYLKNEFMDFNKSPNVKYEKFLSSVGYSIHRSASEIRKKLIEMNKSGLIPRRKH